jgi:hypothetical protein
MVKKDISMLIHQLISKRQNVTKIQYQADDRESWFLFKKRRKKGIFLPLPFFRPLASLLLWKKRL